MREQPDPYKFLQVFYVQEKERFLNDKMKITLSKIKARKRPVFWLDKALSVQLEGR
ncbi:hypothetical protein ID0094_06290 [Helicobacter pylori]